MGADENFQKLIDEHPSEALKYIKELEQNAAWKYYQAKLKKEIDASIEELRECPLEKILTVRGFIKAIEYAQKLSSEIIDTLKDNIELQKEAAKIEAARTPDKGQMPGQTP